MPKTLFLRLGEDYDVVEVNDYIIVQDISKDFIHQAEESGWGIGQPER